MNERIRELAEQAEVIYCDGEYREEDLAALQKFAELIVAECLDNCMAANDRDRIREHFGVES